MRAELAPIVDSSRAVQVGTSGLERVTSIASESRAVVGVLRGWNTLRAAWGGSATETRVSATRGLIGGSTIIGAVSQAIDRVTTAGSRALEQARVASLGEWGTRKTRQSFLYNWLTAEPEPEVIVIDLRETYTAGPIIAGLDRAIASAMPGVQSATVTQAVRSAAAVFRERPLRYVGIAGAIVVVLSFLATVVLGAASAPVVIVHVLLTILFGLGIRSDRSWEAVAAHPVSQWLAEAFEPPEPIEPERDED